MQSPRIIGDHIEDKVSPQLPKSMALPGLLLEGIFAITKPTTVTTPQILLDLQCIFAASSTFAPLLADARRKRAEQQAHQPPGQKLKDEEKDGRFFKMGHGGTLDPMASGVLIIGLGRGTKQLSNFLSCTKTYETVVLFGVSTDTYDIDGTVLEEAVSRHVDVELVKSQLGQFMGRFRQMPPIYSALKINGIKACEYVRQGKELPRELEDREVNVEECELLDFMEAGTHAYRHRTSSSIAAPTSAARIKLTVSSGFYVRSFAHDLGVACGTVATMAALHRSRQASFTTASLPESSEIFTAVTYEDLNAGEEIWGPKISTQLSAWMEKNTARKGNPRDPGRPQCSDDVPRRRFRGEWLADTRKERIKQQGGRTKGKHNSKPQLRPEY
ncbi:tRNA pseudouridine synthase B [Massarina eburnea CBS 473.64]|uniref:tRNA pseudouridine(55) synthase n=1 Tax=Massarina eburnea CBS 473.64 TaxID=1395130 RepID=A0A6A6RX82_9PLEO|nr:tRNA pseudouridine synthase B [Massarina eburnea CBS 473.64]